MMQLKNILRFAFWLHEQATTPSASVVRTALHEHQLEDIEFAGTPRQLTDICRLIVMATRMRGPETNAIDARFSLNSHVNFGAKVHIAKHFRAALHDHTRHFDLLVKLVERHYLEPAERIGAWSIPAISDQFRASRTRIEQAQAILSQHIDQLETVALDNLRREMEQKKLFNHAAEAA